MIKTWRAAVVVMTTLWLTGTLYAGPNKLDRELAKRSKDKNAASQKVRIIIQHYAPVQTSDVDTIEKKHKGAVLKRLGRINALAAEVTVGELNSLSDEPNVAQVSFDDIVATSSAGLPRTVTGAADVAKDPYRLSGNGIGVAVIDSGIADRPDLPNVKMVVDFVQDGNTNKIDPFGHGTHVAGIIGDAGKSARGRYKGIAPDVKLVDLRVLDASGKGYTSDVIAAIDWAITNRNIKGNDGQPLNIRILNLSLGHRPYESAATDPLTVECRKAVQSGLVVVVAAGNYGKDANGNEVYGSISSPGTEPSVITVGAMRTWGTDNRSDDSLAPYSSKGPTYIDHLAKPDIVAPGSNIVSVQSPNSTLIQKYPQIKVDPENMVLSGTSMAAAVISGAAALVLQENPSLTPNAVKAILMYTAEKRNESRMKVGAGYVNIEGAVALASNINSSAPVSQYWIINPGSLVYSNAISGSPVVWSQTIVWGDAASLTANAILYNQPAWSQTIVWGDASGQDWATTIVWDSTIVWDIADTIVWDSTIVWDDSVNLSYAEAVGLETVTWPID